jgi:MinD superfamily P-loop ATPase
MQEILTTKGDFPHTHRELVQEFPSDNAWAGDLVQLRGPAGLCCRACQQQCQFGAIGYSVVRHQAFIDPLHCHGCGICRVACDYGAIHLIPRSEDELARDLW